MAKSTANRQHRNNQFSKTKMCRFELLGMCAKGPQCPFAHGTVELRPLPDLSRTKLCRQLLQCGECHNPGCAYAHSREELREVVEAAAMKPLSPGNVVTNAGSPKGTRRGGANKRESASQVPQSTGDLPQPLPMGLQVPRLALGGPAPPGLAFCGGNPQSAELSEDSSGVTGANTLSGPLSFKDQSSFNWPQTAGDWTAPPSMATSKATLPTRSGTGQQGRPSTKDTHEPAYVPLRLGPSIDVVGSLTRDLGSRAYLDEVQHVRVAAAAAQLGGSEFVRQSELMLTSKLYGGGWSVWDDSLVALHAAAGSVLAA